MRIFNHIMSGARHQAFDDVAAETEQAARLSRGVAMVGARAPASERNSADCAAVVLAKTKGGNEFGVESGADLPSVRGALGQKVWLLLATLLKSFLGLSLGLRCLRERVLSGDHRGTSIVNLTPRLDLGSGVVFAKSCALPLHVGQSSIAMVLQVSLPLVRCGGGLSKNLLHTRGFMPRLLVA